MAEFVAFDAPSIDWYVAGPHALHPRFLGRFNFQLSTSHRREGEGDLESIALSGGHGALEEIKASLHGTLRVIRLICSEFNHSGAHLPWLLARGLSSWEQFLALWANCDTIVLRLFIQADH